MIGFRYNIVEVLGRGGGGEVLLVDDTLTGRRVAMKVLNACADDDEGRQEAQKEFGVLSSLDHPNVIEVFDLGTASHDIEGGANRLWYTMTYVAGKDAGEYFHRMRGSAQFAEHLEIFAIQALGALAYIHARGITHFDIKPQNFLMAPGTDRTPFTAMLTDFGFSAREIENVENPLRGTMEYTAPEIFQGGEANLRSDLYSLGITLFELIAGRCPFTASDPVELIQHVLNDDLPPLDSPLGASAQLVNLIFRLCKKNPDERIPTAETALQELRSDQLRLTIDEHIFLARKPAFTGRTSELQEIGTKLEQFAGAPDRYAGSINIATTSGMGFSALLNELHRLAASHRHRVLKLRGERTPRSCPDEFKQIVAQLWMEVQTTGAEEHVNRLLTLASSRNKDADTVKFLIDASRVAPFILLVDNAGRLNSSTSQIIEKLLESDSRILVVGANLSSPAPARHATITLGALSQEDIAAMMHGAFPDDDTAEAANGLYALSGGIPSGAVPVIESLLRSRPGRRVPSGAALAELIPESVHEFFRQRLNNYSEPAAHAMTMLSCFDTAPTKEMISELLADISVDDKSALHELSSGLEIHVHSDNRLELRAALMKHAAYERLSAARAHDHEMIAEAFEKRAPLTDWRDMREHARQHELAGKPLRAATLYEVAADAARKAERFGEAAVLFRKALETGTEHSSTGRPRLQKKLADTLYADGEFQASIDSAAEILKNSDDNGEFRGTVLVAMGKSYSRVGEFQQAQERLREARTFLTNDRGRFEIEQEMTGIEIAEGKFEQAVKRCETLKATAQRIGDDQLLASVYTDLGIASFYRGMLDDALAAFRESHRLYSVSGNLVKTVDASLNAGNVLSAKGDHRGALKESLQALEESRKLGNRNQQAQILNNLGIAHYHLREHEKAAQRYEEALAIFQELNSTSGIALTRLNLGEVALALSHYERAIDHWQIALRRYEEMNDPAGVADTALHLARVWAILEDQKQLEAFVAKGQMASDSAGLHDFDGDIAFLTGLHLLFAGALPDAQQYFSKAKELFSARDVDGSGGREKTLRASIELSRTTMLLGDRNEAVKQLGAVEKSIDAYPLLAGELRLLLGTCRESDAMNQYKLGLTAIADLDVAEVTWKLMHALSREFGKRGNSLKAREQSQRASMVLHYLADQFHSPELRSRYLNGKERACLMAEQAPAEPTAR